MAQPCLEEGRTFSQFEHVLVCRPGSLLWDAIARGSATAKFFARFDGFRRCTLDECSVAMPQDERLNGLPNALAIYFMSNTFKYEPPD